MTSRAMWKLLVLGIIGATGCGESVEPTKRVPEPAVLSVRLSVPVARNDSGIVFSIAGPTRVRGTSTAGMLLFQRDGLNLTTRFAVVGPLSSGATLLTFPVSDVRSAGAYNAVIEAVTGSDGQLRALPDGYAITIEP